jgi:hypothetical protein
MPIVNSLLDTIYNDYLVSFAYHANATAQNNKLIAPFVKDASVNTILFLCVGVAILSIISLYTAKSILVCMHFFNL